MSIFDFIESGLDPEGYQRRKISEHENRIESLSDSTYMSSQELRTRVARLEQENAKVELVCVTILQILVDRQLITKEGFIELARQIDAEDGRLDGHYNGAEILPKAELLQKSEIKIDFNSARQKPQSLNL